VSANNIGAPSLPTSSTGLLQYLYYGAPTHCTRSTGLLQYLYNGAPTFDANRMQYMFCVEQVVSLVVYSSRPWV
jgi:hypothetical protein